MRAGFARDAYNIAAKESFVSGHKGTTLLEINNVIGIVPLIAFLSAAASNLFEFSVFRTAQSRLKHLALRRKVRRTTETCALVFTQVAIMMDVIPPGIAAASVAAVAFATVLGLSIRTMIMTKEQRVERAKTAAIAIGARHASYLSDYRGAMMLSTCIAILAVDFQAFPRRFAKVETYGTGLMDAGVGSFVAASGLVSHGSSGRASWSRSSALHCVALLALGLSRLVATQGVKYQLAVGEYGQHWNFFFTLAVVKIMTAVVPVPQHLAMTAGLAVAAGHQATLCWGLAAVAHSPARGPSLLSLNKEGVISLPGYWALHLISAGVGAHLNRSRAKLLHVIGPAAGLVVEQPCHLLARWRFLPDLSRRDFDGFAALIRNRHGPKTGKRCEQVETDHHSIKISAASRWLLQLFAWTAAAWVAVWATLAFVSPVSRRACNLAYITWTLAFNLQVLLFFAAANVLVPSPKSQLLGAINQRMLPMFLAANMLTGCINILMDTLSASDWTARMMVSAYGLVLCTVVQVAE